MRLLGPCAIWALAAVVGLEGEGIVLLQLTVQLLPGADQALSRGLVHHHSVEGDVLPMDFKSTNLTWKRGVKAAPLEGLSPTALGRRPFSVRSPPRNASHPPHPCSQRNDNSSQGEESKDTTVPGEWGFSTEQRGLVWKAALGIQSCRGTEKERREWGAKREIKGGIDRHFTGDLQRGLGKVSHSQTAEAGHQHTVPSSLGWTRERRLKCTTRC